MRKLASIQRIWKIEPIEGADRIELAHVLGWQCVVNKGQFQPMDTAVYTQGRIIALALGDSVEHLRSLLLHAILPQGLTGNPQHVIDIAISPYERTVRFD